MDHNRLLSINSNRFEKNTGLKGIINIEKGENSVMYGGILIKSNEFKHNTGLVDSNVLNIW